MQPGKSFYKINLMLGLTQDTVNLITVMAVVLMVPWLAVMIAAMLMRQIRRFGFGGYWGSDAEDLRIDGF